MIGSQNGPTPYLVLAATCKVYEILRKKSSLVAIGSIRHLLRPLVTSHESRLSELEIF